MAKNNGKKKKSKVRIGYESARILALAVFLVCAGIIGNKIYGYVHDDETEVVFMQENDMTIGVTPVPAERTAPPYPEVTPTRVTYPQIVSTADIAKLEKYDDFVCWIYIDGTNISNYVLQGESNEYYLRKNIDKQQNGNGSLFLDFRCDYNVVEGHYVIYGHNQKNGTMFSDLRDFNDPEFFYNHQYIYTYSSRGVKIWKVFSAYETSTEDNYIETWFENTASYYDFIRSVQDRSIAESDVVLQQDSVVLSLSTCYKYTNPNGRYVVHAVLVDEAPLA